MKEIWKDIEGYIGLYQISNYGRIKSLSRVRKGNKGAPVIVPEKILKQSKTKDGYLHASLNKNGNNKKNKVHRLVSKAFIPNPENKPCIDHINGDKTDNRVENLRWCTHKENMNNPLVLDIFKSRIGVKNGFSKSVIQFTKDNELIRKWDSMADVKRELGIDSSDISCCCSGKRKTAGGSKWKYYDTDTYLIALMVKNLKAKGITLRNAS